MTSQYNAKIINELKQHQSDHIDMPGMLYLLHRLISKKHYPLEYVHRFITNNYSHSDIAWKTMDESTILNLHRQSLDYIELHQKLWRIETQTHSRVLQDYIEEKKRIKKILKEKSFTKEELIDTYLEQIRRNRTLLAKASPQKISTQKSSKQAPSINDKYKIQQNIQLLQKRINIMRDHLKFDQENDDKTLTNQTNSKFLAQQVTLTQLLEQLQFKINYFEDLQKNSQLEEAFQMKKKVTAQTKSFSRKIKHLFLHYSSQNYDPSVSFQKNQFKLVHMDLRLFLKYFKQLKEAHQGQYFANDQKNQKKLKTNNLTIVFKKYAKNQRQINFLQFLQINYELFLNKENAFDKLTEDQIFGQTKGKISIYSHESLNQFEDQIKKFEEIKDVFYNEKVGKIINIKQKYDENSRSSKMTERNFLKKKQTEQSLTNGNDQKIGKFIDKSLQDYEKTRNKIHETFMRRHRKETVQNFEQRLNANESNSIKIIVSTKRKSVSSRSMNEKNVSNMKNQDDKSSNYPKDKNDNKIFLMDKNVFNSIIKEVDEENDEENTFLDNRYKKSRSSADLLQAKYRTNKSDDRQIQSFLTRRRSSAGSLKTIFTLPRITRLSQQKIQNQSITKTLSYLYNKLGKQQEPRIKKILEIDGSKSQKVNKIENEYLNEYFSKESNLENLQKNQNEDKKAQHVKPSCKKFREQSYQKFMKFS